jgi:hypothetical protein
MFWSAVGSVLDKLDGRVLFVRLWYCEAGNGVAACQVIELDGDIGQHLTGTLRQSLNLLTFAMYRTDLAGMENASMLPIREQRLMMEIERYVVGYLEES